MLQFVPSWPLSDWTTSQIGCYHLGFEKKEDNTYVVFEIEGKLFSSFFKKGEAKKSSLSWYLKNGGGGKG